MNDPVLAKLKADAGIVLVDLWRAFRHQPAVEDREWLHPRVTLPGNEAGRGEPVQGGPQQSGLCYFHLN